VRDLDPEQDNLEILILESFHQASPSELAVAQRDPRQLVAPFVKVLASHYLSDLRSYEDSIVHATTSPGENNNSTEVLFQEDLRAVQDLSETVKIFFGPNSNSSISPAPIIGDIAFLRQRYEIVDQYRRSQLNYEASIASLKESRLGIQQNQSVKRLTQLAFIFIPLSFITSVFGMNINLLSGNGVQWWTVLIGAIVVYLIVTVGVIIINLQRIKKWW
jgi:hypothetical protein